MKLTKQQIDKLLEHVLQLQEQPSFDNLETIQAKRKQQQQNKQLEKNVLAKRGLRPIPGLTGEYGMPLKGTQAQWIAQIIYDAKGIISDNENNATRAILAINDKSEFEATQRALQKLAGGRGIGQYVASFFGTYTDSYIKSLEQHDTANKLAPVGKIVYELLGNRNHWKSERRLNKIITHLKKIGAYSSTISELQKAYDKIKYIASLENKIWQSSIIKATKDFIEEYRHEILLVLEIATSLIPFPVGFMISAGIGLANAGLYASEGEYYQAGVTAVFAMMPSIGKLVGKIPAIAKLGAKAMGRLGQKLITKSGQLTRTEQIIVKGLIGMRNTMKSIYFNYLKTQARQAEMAILAKASFKSIISRGKANPELMAKVARLSGLDKMMIMISRGIIGVTEFALIMTAWSKGTDFLVKNAWDPIYNKYLANTEYEEALVKDLVGK
jgi:hypothetical protein